MFLLRENKKQDKFAFATLLERSQATSYIALKKNGRLSIDSVVLIPN